MAPAFGPIRSDMRLKTLVLVAIAFAWNRNRLSLRSLNGAKSGAPQKTLKSLRYACRSV